jgi:8-oxo-dGTP pyrophosphatase MutT (NUDIX family)
MAIPDFLAELRAVVGHRLLWLPAVTAVVVDDRGRVLLGQRADNHRWNLIGGILEPGEQPADGVVRECLEETGVTVEPLALAVVDVSPIVVYPNGDRCQYLDMVFRCRTVSGRACVNDDESLDVGWFARTELPPLDDYARRRLAAALDGRVGAFRVAT